MIRTRLLLLAFLALALPVPRASSQEVGPENGSLVIVGGAMQDPAILERFIQLAGGPQAPIVIIPTAGGGEEYDEFYGGLRAFHSLGAFNLTVLHTNDPAEADTEAFVKPIAEANGVWFPGGRQWRLADAYLGTRTEEELWRVLERGGVIGGSSAGATIQGSYLVRGDTRTNTIMMGDHEEGFGFIKNIAIDQHVLARNRQFDLFTILDKKPELLGVGLDEGTAMIVQGNTFEVMGRSYVLVSDQSFWSREGSNLKNLPEQNRQFYFLRPGDRYDMKARKVLQRGGR